MLPYKQWLATPDERTRPTHVEAHDQTVPVKQMFTVGTAQMLYPGDPNGPDGKEVINCRCTLIYVDDLDEVSGIEDGCGAPPATRSNRRSRWSRRSRPPSSTRPCTRATRRACAKVAASATRPRS